MDTEKKTDNINVRIPETMLHRIEVLASLEGLSVSAWARSLIEKEVDAQRKRYACLSTIFGDEASGN